MLVAVVPTNFTTTCNFFGWWKHHATGVSAKRGCCASWGEFSVVNPFFL